MIKIVEKKIIFDHHRAKVLFEGKTVKEVLQEIKEYTNDQNNGEFHKIGDFGNTRSFGGNAWGITINRIPYIGSWNGWENHYKGQYDNYTVTEIKASGGWYCAWDFEIYVDPEEFS